MTSRDDAEHRTPGAPVAEPYDFRRPDRIAKDQLRAIHALHENFARALGSSLSAYLRAYAVVNLVSVEQMSFAEFSQSLPSPTCIVSLGMRPFDGNTLLEINPTLIFPILEMLLGGTGKTPAKVNREVTEIEQIILEGFFRVILNDLRVAWQPVAALQFSVESFGTEPQLLQLFAPNEAVIAITMEVRIGDSAGMLNICIPSMIVKMLRQKLDQQWSARKTEATEDEHLRLFRLIKQAQLAIDARLQGPTLRVRDLLQLEDGQVLALDFPVAGRIDLLVNGKLKFQGEVVGAGRKRAFEISGPFPANE